MAIRFRRYEHAKDFLPVRDLLVSTYRPRQPINWDLCRWNYARYFVAPPRHGGEGIRFWEETIGVWENDEDGVVGVVNCEYPELGAAWLQRHPRYSHVLDAMLAYAETTFADAGRIRIGVWDHDAELQEAACRRGYEKEPESNGQRSEYLIRDMPALRLPHGYAVHSMADDNDIELRRKVVGLAFNHPDPADWPSAATYAELQKAPDYRKDLDLYVLAPDGQYVSCCIVWYDERNRWGTLEPVRARPEFRRMGFGTAVVTEAIRRVAVLGAERVEVGSSMPFYMAIGFRATCTTHAWTKSR
jgi:predicted N-acetyltransferase YhbS